MSYLYERIMDQVFRLFSLRKLLKLYAIFALFNVLYKVRQLIKQNKRANELLKHLPGGNYSLSSVKGIIQNGKRIHDYISEKILQYPTAPLIKGFGPLREVVCNTPESIEWMLKTEFMDVTKPGGDEDYGFFCLGQFIGNNGIFTLRHGEGILADEHNKWHLQRKATSLIFTKNNFLNLMRNTFCEKADVFVDLLRQKAKSNEYVDMQENFFAFTMDSIQKIFFGKDVNTIGSAQEDSFAKAFDNAHASMVLHMFTSIPQQILCRLLLPYPFGTLKLNKGQESSLVMRLTRLMSKHFREFQKQATVLDETCRKEIAKVRGDRGIAQRKDMVANFLNAKGGERLDDDTLRDIILNLTIAGRDTTACALTWMFYLLTQHPDVQEKVQAEIDEKLGDKSPEVEDVSPENMPYLNGVLYETLRLYPPVPVDVKIAKKDLMYLDGNTLIPEGTHLGFVPYTMGRNPAIYKEPLKVDPTRWIPFAQPSLFEFPVFQAGPRFCLGKDMAQFEAKLLAAKLLRNFSFSLKEGEQEKITYSNNITMSLCNSPEKDSYNLWIKPLPRHK